MDQGTRSRVYEQEIRATPSQLWKAITDPDITQKYFFGARVESDWTPGSQIVYRNADGGVDADGEILEVQEGHRLRTTFRPAWGPDLTESQSGRITWEIQPSARSTHLVLEHSGFDFDSPAGEQVDQGWLATLADLKSLLESDGT